MIFIGCGFILADFISPHTYTILVAQTIQVPKQETIQRNEKVASVENLVLSGGYFTRLPDNGIYIEPGKTFKVSWSADGNVKVYILTENQYEYFKFWGVASNYEACDYGKQGTISIKVKYRDKYYGIIYNSVILGQSVKVYEAEAIITWKETVTKLENKTNYVPQEIEDDLYLYLGCIFLPAGIIGVVVGCSKREKIQL